MRCVAPISHALITCAAFVVTVFVATTASAIQIDLIYDEVDKPAFDPGGVKLWQTARAAADIWES